MGEMDRGAQFSASKGGEMETGMNKWKKGKEEEKKKKHHAPPSPPIFHKSQK